MEQRNLNARIDELEARLAQQDQSVLELSDEIYRQQRQIGQLESKVRDLTERLRALAAADPQGESNRDSADETPPHY